MIGAGVTILSFLLLGGIFGVFRMSNYKNEDGDWSPSAGRIIKSVLVIIVSLVIGMVQPIDVQRIDGGSVGIKVDRIGNDKGVPMARPCKGWVFYNKYTTDVEYDLRPVHIEYKGMDVATKGGFGLKATMAMLKTNAPTVLREKV